MRFIVLLLSGILMLACEGEGLMEDMGSTDPVFFFKGRIDSKDVDIQAGNEGYYMFSSFVQNDDNKVDLIAYLADENGGSQEALQIILKDLDVDLDFVQKMTQLNYPFFENDALRTDIQFIPMLHSFPNPGNIQWEINGQTYNESFPMIPIEDLNVEENVHINLNLLSDNFDVQFDSQLTNISDEGYVFSMSPSTNNTMLMKIEPLHPIQHDVIWIGNQQTPLFLAPCSANEIDASLIEDGLETLSLTTSALDCSLDPITVGFRAKQITRDQEIKEEQCIINYFDANGKKYSTEFTKQGTSGSIRLNTVESYERNERNEKTVIVSFDLMAFVTDQSLEQSIRIDATETSFAFAIPE